MPRTDRDNPVGRELVSDVNPTFNWVRLAQRVPVRIHIDTIPPGVPLAAGTTCTVVVTPAPAATSPPAPATTAASASASTTAR